MSLEAEHTSANTKDLSLPSLAWQVFLACDKACEVAYLSSCNNNNSSSSVYFIRIEQKL